jgi:hypothetical protein
MKLICLYLISSTFIFSVLFITIHFFLPSVHFEVNSMAPKKEENKKRSRKRTYRENVTDQPASNIITNMPTGRADTSGGYREGNAPQQGPNQSSGPSAAAASTVINLPSVSCMSSTSGLTQAPAGLPSYQPDWPPISTGIVGF